MTEKNFKQSYPGGFYSTQGKAVDFKKLSGITYQDEINSFFIQLLDKRVIPWYSTWCQPVPVNHLTKEEFRGINFLSLRANYPGFCPLWLPESYIKENNLQIKKGEHKGTPVIMKNNGTPTIERFYNLEKLQDVEMPKIEKPTKPPIEESGEKILDFFKEIKKHDKFTGDIKDFLYHDHYYYLLFQYLCYNWYCQEYEKDMPFRPDLYNRYTLIFRIGAAFLASYCCISTPWHSVSSLERNCWKMLLQQDSTIIFDAAGLALKMYDSVINSISLKKAS